MQKHSKPSDRLVKIIDQFPKLSITVLGDLIADEFIYGEISRVSREAPVLILRHRSRAFLPGGAGNAIYNLADLGVNVLPVGVVGDDEAGRALLRAFRQKHISITGIRRVRGRATVTKTRILAGTTHSPRQQVIRVDREPDTPLDRAAVHELIFQSRGYVRASDALLLSDYGYGAATPEIFDSIRARVSLSGVPITVDSRYRLLSYDGITAATPNEAELEEALRTRIGNDTDRLLNAGKAILQKLKLQSLVVTRGRDGMMVFARGSKPRVRGPGAGGVDLQRGGAALCGPADAHAPRVRRGPGL